MPAADSAAISAHNVAIPALTAAMYRPLRKAGVVDPLLVAAQTAVASALAATNAATTNPAQAGALALQLRKYSRQQNNITAVLGVKRRHALRGLRNASRALIALHQVNV